MAHTVYKTEGFVLGGTNIGEGHRYITLFTKDLGLVKAHARSVREERSRLRYSLQHFSYSDFSLVRGRDVWRITGAREHYNIHRALSAERQKQVMVSRLFALLERLLHGEEKNEPLFSTLVVGCEFLQNNTLDDEALQNVECVLVLRILNALGYVGEQKRFEEIMYPSALSQEVLEKVVPLRRAAVSEINRALEASQL